MQVSGIVYFATTLFAALAALAKWKRRRDLKIERVNRGLRSYVVADRTEEPNLPADTSGADALVRSGPPGPDLRIRH
jgi:hypothetical protein